MPVIVTDDQAPLDPAEPTADSGTGFRCEICGTGPLYYAGRGRYPRFCDEHKAEGKGTTTATKRTSTRSIDTLLAQMTDIYAGMATGLTFIPSDTLQVDGMIVANNASKLAESWRPLLERDPKVRKFWERMTTGSGYSAVIITHLLVALPILGNHGLLPTKLVETVVATEQTTDGTV